MEKEQSHQANDRILQTKIEYDEIVDEVCRIFTLQKPSYHTFQKHQKPKVPDNFKIGVIVGSSGSGKTLLLKEFGEETQPEWNNKAVCSHFENYQEAEKKLLGAGLSSIPIWLAPYRILSNGQKYRADVARRLENNAVFDEFTSVIDRETSMSLANSIRTYILRNSLSGVVFSTPHHDIIDYLQPDWVYDTNKRCLILDKKYENKSKTSNVVVEMFT